MCLWLISSHLLAVLKHHFIKKANTLVRFFPLLVKLSRFSENLPFFGKASYPLQQSKTTYPYKINQLQPWHANSTISR